MVANTTATQMLFSIPPPTPPKSNHVTKIVSVVFGRVLQLQDIPFHFNKELGLEMRAF